MAEEVIPFSMVMVPFVIALGYDSIVAVTVTYVASQVGNATSWMSPFSVAVAQGLLESRVVWCDIPIDYVGSCYCISRWLYDDICRKIRKNQKVR